MRVLIHAGIHRTGTTSLQKALTDNRARIEAHGVRYAGQGINHQSLAWALKRGQAGAADVLALLDESGPRTTVLSAEDFCILDDLRWLKNLTEKHDVYAVFYLRRQDHWLMSWYNQNIKWPFNSEYCCIDPDSFIERREEFYWLRFDTLLDRWASVLGDERIIVRVVETAQVTDVVGDFLDIVDLPRAALSEPASRSNDSLPLQAVQLARHLGLMEMTAAQRMRVLAALVEALDRHKTSAATLFAPWQRRAVLADYADGNRTAAQHFLGRDALFFEPSPADDEPFFRLPEMPVDELMRDWIGPVIHALVAPRGRCP